MKVTYEQIREDARKACAELVEIAKLTVKKGLTVRQLEAMAKKEQQQPKQKAIKKSSKRYSSLPSVKKIYS